MWRAATRVAVDLVRTTGAYMLLVLWGTVAVLVVSTLVGYLPYSDRPGPGWQGVQHTLSVAGVWFFLSWAGFAAVHVFTVGIMLFLGARILQLIMIPRWIIRVLGAPTSAFLSLYVVAGVGWYIAIAPFPVYAAGVLGFAFGAFLLVPTQDDADAQRPRARHWIALGAPIVIVGLGAGMSYVRSLSDQRLQVVFVKWDDLPQEGGIVAKTGAGPPLATEELDQLRSAGLRGTLTVVGSFTQGSGPDARMVVVMKTQPLSPVTLYQPDQGKMVYVQDQENWARYPSDAPVLDRLVELYTPAESPSHTRFWVQLASGAQSGGTATTW